MSSEFGKVSDNLDEKNYIEIGSGSGGIKILSTQKKIWLSVEGAKRMKALLDTAIAYFERLENNMKIGNESLPISFFGGCVCCGEITNVYGKEGAPLTAGVFCAKCIKKFQRDQLNKNG